MNRSQLMPLFIHGGLRTGSTYVFSKFRSLPSTRCWYEPFQQALMQATVEYLTTHGPSSWSSGHPQMTPYFLEYTPLLNETGIGIRGFKPEFSFDNYFKVVDELPDQFSYLNTLNAFAESHQKQSVLGFSKSMGRVAWMKRRFPGARHITVIRNPVQQWLSAYYLFTEHKITNFLTASGEFLARPGDNAYLHGVYQENRDILSRSTFPVDTLYEIFLHVYGASMAEALPHSDLVIDIDRLSESTAYRSFISNRLEELSGLAIDFSDSSIRNHPINGPVHFDRVNTRVLERLSAYYSGSAAKETEDYDRTPYAALEKIETSLL